MTNDILPPPDDYMVGHTPKRHDSNWANLDGVVCKNQWSIAVPKHTQNTFSGCIWMSRVSLGEIMETQVPGGVLWIPFFRNGETPKKSNLGTPQMWGLGEHETKPDMKNEILVGFMMWFCFFNKIPEKKHSLSHSGSWDKSLNFTFFLLLYKYLSSSNVY